MYDIKRCRFELQNYLSALLALIHSVINIKQSPDHTGKPHLVVPVADKLAHNFIQVKVPGFGHEAHEDL